jgi:probable phosphoglycerate mutase
MLTDETAPRIYLLRHGETAWNVEGRYQGQKDSRLTDRGRSQVASLGRLLASELGPQREPLVSYVSPLGRTQESAEIVARYVALERIDEPRLAEVSLGSWDGLSDEEIEMAFPRARAGTDAFDWYFRSPDGETFDAACDRVTSWLADVRRPVLAISHGLIGRLVRGVFLGLERRVMLELPVPQNALYELVGGSTRSIRELRTSSAFPS